MVLTLLWLFFHQKQKAEEETRKQREIEGLQKQLQQLKDMASGKAPVDESVLDKDVKKPPATKVGSCM